MVNSFKNDNKNYQPNIEDNTNINLYKHIEDSKNPDSVLNYLKFFNFTQYKQAIIINSEKTYNNFCILNNGNLLISFHEGDKLMASIIEKKTWKVVKTWILGENIICQCVHQLENNFVVLILGYSIQIWNVNEENPKLLSQLGELKYLNKIGVVSKNRIVTFENPKFAVWSINEPFSSEPIHYLDYTNSDFETYFFNKERNILILNCQSNIGLINMETYQTISVIVASPEVKYMLEYDNNNVFCIGAEHSFYFINLDDNKIKDVSFWDEDIAISDIMPSRDKKMFITRNYTQFNIMNIETKEFYPIYFENGSKIISLVPLDANHFITRDNSSIRIWTY